MEEEQGYSHVVPGSKSSWDLGLDAAMELLPQIREDYDADELSRLIFETPEGMPIRVVYGVALLGKR